MDSYSTLLVFSGLLAVILAVRGVVLSVRSYHRLPPGPPQKLISGNAHQVPPSRLYLKYASWAKEYGPIFTVRYYGRRQIIISSAGAVLDLLEGRSYIYSDRPTTVFSRELIGRKSSVFGISSSNPRFRKYRKLLNTGLNPRATASYAGLVENEVKVFLRNLRDTPGEFIPHLRRNAGAVILKVTYGWTVKSDDDYFVELIRRGFELTASVSRPAGFLVNTIPWLRFIPEWFPGAGFKRFARELRKELRKIDNIPYEWTKEQMAAGTNTESFISRLLRPEDGHSVDEEEADIVKWCSSALYTGGAETTVSAMTAFFLVMALYPDVQARARAEVDAVVGNDQLPKLNNVDPTRLPYVVALIKEILRWAPVAPLGLHHRLTRDDSYMGYFIPGGTTIIPNIWAIMHDPETFPDPETFNPERFLDEKYGDQPDPRKFAFGFGRRVCPGAHFAETSILLSVSSILSVFTISKCTDEKGQDIAPQIGWRGSTVSHFKPFECDIKPRSAAALALLESDD